MSILSSHFKLSLLSVICIITLFTSTIDAQNLELPAKSPKASISYVVGFTEIKIQYSSPAVRDRELWGNVVPYGEVWRAGANEATTISFSTDINIEGTEIPKGTYSLFIIPRKDNNWEVVLNKEVKQWGAYKYDNSKDQAHINVEMKPSQIKQERLIYEIVDQSVEQGYIKIAWGDARLYVRFFVDVVSQGLANIDAALESADTDQKWIIMAQGSEFLLSIDKQIGQAMEWAEKSSELKNSSYNWWIKALVLAKKDLFKEAISSGKKAIENGMADSTDRYYKMNETGIKNTMKSWVSKGDSGT